MSYCIINRIINREILPKCVGIITSRPGISLHLHDKVICRAEILGFSRENRQGFIKSALNDKNDKIKELIDFLQSNPSLNGLCYIPLNMSILLCLTVDGINALPKTQTSLYEKFILMTIIHFLKKNKTISNSTITSHDVTSLDSLFNPYNQVVKELSQFAFLALQKNQLVFTLAEVKAEYPDFTPGNWYGLGLLKPAQYFRVQDGCDYKSFHFLHYSVQEYMAAYYISSLSGSRLSSLLDKTFWNVQYGNTWVMYVGITGGKSVEFKHFLSGNYFKIWSWFRTQSISKTILSDKIKCLHLLRCSAEIDYEEMLSSVEAIFQEEVIDLSSRFLSINDVRMLASLLLKLPDKKWKLLNLSDCSINDECCNLLCELFLSSNMPLKITTVNISDNKFHWESFSKLCNIFHLWKVNKLTMSIEALYDSTTMDIVDHFKSKLETKLLHIGIRIICPLYNREKLVLTYLSEQNKMIAVFVSSYKYRYKIYTDCQLDNDDLIEMLVCFVRSNGRMKDYMPLITINYHIPNHVVNARFSTISCNFNQIVFEGLYMHSKGVFKLKHFSGAMVCINKHVEDLVANLITAAIVHSISQPNQSYLKSIPAVFSKEDLQNYSNGLCVCGGRNSFNSIATSDIATILSYVPNLRAVCFGENNLQSAGAIKIAQALCNISTLTSITLYDNNIGKEAASYIASLLSLNTKLRKVQLSKNNLQTMGAIEIAKGLQNISTLIYLEIADNDINKEAADDIAAALYCNTELKVINFSRNNFQAKGAIKIAKALQNTCTLTGFKMGDNDINEEAADSIAAVISHNTELQELDLNNNNLQTIGIIAIAKALQKICSLTTFGIACNNIREDAAGDIAAALINKNMLTHVDLSGNNFQTIGSVKISRALNNISNLQSLNISKNNIGVEAADDIAAVISHNTKLQTFDLHHNRLQTAGVTIISKGLQRSTALEVFDVSENNISKEGRDHITNVLSCINEVKIIFE